MKPLSAPRQPFVGLALMAATGITVAEIVPLRSTVLILAAIVLGSCILVALCWPKSPATYLIVAAGFFLLHKFATTNTAGQQLSDKLGERPRVITAVGCVITEPKIAPSGFATFLLKLKSIELEGKNESTHAVWQVRWKGTPEFGDELKLFGAAEPIAPPRNPGEFDMRAYLARHDIRRMLFVRYAEDGTLINHGGGNPVLRAAQASRTWMQNALCRGLEDAPEAKSLISGIVLYCLQTQAAPAVPQSFHRFKTDVRTTQYSLETEHKTPRTKPECLRKTCRLVGDQINPVKSLL